MKESKQMSARGRIAAAVFFVLLAGCTAAAASRLSGRSGKAAALKSAVPAVFTAKATPARLARGRYLVEDVAGCFDCHTTHEFVNGQWIGKKGLKGAGQVMNILDLPPHSEVVATNITPDRATGIGAWTDAEIEEAVRHGVAKGGRQLFDLMPYWQFNVLGDEDMKSVIVYLRSLPPVHNALPATHLPFPVHVSMNKNLIPPLPKNASAQIRHGWELVRIAGCEDCHTPVLSNGTRSRSLMFAGGMHFKGPFGDVFSLNITPSASGIGYMTEAMFARTLHTGRVNGTGLKLNSVMPFEDFRNLTAADIQAIYAYLRTVPPVRHLIDNTDPPTLCRICGQKHGLGNRN